MAKLKVFRADVHIYGTLYVKARTKQQAEEIAKKLKGTGFEIGQCEGAIPVSGRMFDDPALPAVSLSPAMTLDALTEAMGNAGE